MAKATQRRQAWPDNEINKIALTLGKILKNMNGQKVRLMRQLNSRCGSDAIVGYVMDMKFSAFSGKQ